MAWYDEATRLIELKKRDESRKITQKEIAGALGVSQGALSARLSGKQKADDAFKEKLASWLNVSRLALEHGGAKSPIYSVSDAINIFNGEEATPIDRATIPPGLKGIAFEVTTDNLGAMLADGGWILIDPNAELVDGKPVLVSVDGEAPTFMFLKLLPGKAALFTQDRNIDPIYVNLDELTFIAPMIHAGWKD
ncbi:LexA family protein [Paraferrimonas haliotis]|uniref:HTH cro/C1-type domain-containing protein n=1 Tax=Paraferrimonas haliotis TaxID=2013866 RepID=A0AA37WWA7_9GAMM|nr:LexA family transcriptional regulator [Paraferrimonas haliotis]GLS83252.1 hypothetical protein GCM10007894_12290 [Paraferrimonas haliotis]